MLERNYVVRGINSRAELQGYRVIREMIVRLATKSKKKLFQLIFHFSLKVSCYVYIIRSVFTRSSKRLNISFSFFIKCGRKTKYARNAIAYYLMTETHAYLRQIIRRCRATNLVNRIGEYTVSRRAYPSTWPGSCPSACPCETDKLQADQRHVLIPIVSY